MQFKSKIFILPGLGNSGDGHWQTRWQNQFNFERIDQTDWETPIRKDWITTVEAAVSKVNPADVILVGHSLACNTIVSWANQTKHKIKAALLVAPSDTEAHSYPSGTTGFTPMPLNKVQFPTLTIASSNDPYVFFRAQNSLRGNGEANTVASARMVTLMLLPGMEIGMKALSFLKNST